MDIYIFFIYLTILPASTDNNELGRFKTAAEKHFPFAPVCPVQEVLFSNSSSLALAGHGTAMHGNKQDWCFDCERLSLHQHSLFEIINIIDSEIIQ